MGTMFSMLVYYFNPRSREGSDRFLGDMHALLVISIHAPVKGAIIPGVSRYRTANDFNPRSREGSDNQHTAEGSIAGYFNPRSREGSDKQASKDAGDAKIFQSTLP